MRNVTDCRIAVSEIMDEEEEEEEVISRLMQVSQFGLLMVVGGNWGEGGRGGEEEDVSMVAPSLSSPSFVMESLFLTNSTGYRSKYHKIILVVCSTKLIFLADI